MTITTAYTQKENIQEAIADIKQQLKDITPAFLTYFASTKYEPNELAREINAIFSCTSIGATTAGEIVSGSMLKNSLVVMAMDNQTIEDAKIEIIENLPNQQGLKTAIKNIETHYKSKLSDLDTTKYAGIILIDGMSMAEEKVMEYIGDQTHFLFVGGSAGDDMKFAKTFVFSKGRAYTNAVLLCVIKVKGSVEILKTQSFRIKKNKWTATKVDEKNREILELDGKPAAEAYAKAIESDMASAAKFFMKNPVGLLVNKNDIYVRSPQRIIGSKIKFYCSVIEGMELSLLESTDIVKDTKKAIDTKQKEAPIAGIINFHCILRTLQLEESKQTKAYGEIFSKIPTIGFSTYGEQYIGHINQTSTMLLFR